MGKSLITVMLIYGHWAIMVYSESQNFADYPPYQTWPVFYDA